MKLALLAVCFIIATACAKAHALSALPPEPAGRTVVCVVLATQKDKSKIDYAPLLNAVNRLALASEISMVSQWRYALKSKPPVLFDALVKDRDKLRSVLGQLGKSLKFELDTSELSSDAVPVPSQSNCTLLLSARLPSYPKPCGEQFGSWCKLKCEGPICTPYYWVDGEFSLQ